jgi:hypothetical protein
MPNTLRKPPPSMTVAEFIACQGDATGQKCHLIDIIHSTRVQAEALRRGPDGQWPDVQVKKWARVKRSRSSVSGSYILQLISAPRRPSERKT